MTKLRTITLTGRPPVRIDEAVWPIISRGSELTHNGDTELRARTWETQINVRRHADGRAIVYGFAAHTSEAAGVRGYIERAGVLLGSGADLVLGIQLVAVSLVDQTHADDTARFDRVVRICIANLPAEALP